MNFGELLKIVLKKGNFLFLCCAPPRIIRVHLSTLHNKDEVLKMSFVPLLIPTVTTVWCTQTKHTSKLLVHLFHSGRQVLNKELPQVVQGLQLLGLGWGNRENVK